VVEYGQHRAGDEAHDPRALRYGGEENDRIGAVAAVTGEIVLDRACVRKPQSFRFFRDRKRLGIVSGGALVGVIDGGKKLHAELHVVPSSRSARVEVSACDDGMSRTIGRQSLQSIERIHRRSH
jgi:hypothetical protein